MYDGVYNTSPPWADIPCSIRISAVVGVVSVPKTSALAASRLELCEDASFGIGTLLVVKRSSLEHRTEGGRNIHRRMRQGSLYNAYSAGIYAAGNNTGTTCSGNRHYSAHCRTGPSHLRQAVSRARITKRATDTAQPAMVTFAGFPRRRFAPRR